jgi:hypothetical protein
MALERPMEIPSYDMMTPGESFYPKSAMKRSEI